MSFGHIRVNDRLRICFRWEEGNAYEVEIVDYGWGHPLSPTLPREGEGVFVIECTNAMTYPPIHPGEHLPEDFMKPLELSANRVSLDLRVPVTRISELIHGKRRITADTALRPGRYFGSSPELWLNLQTHYDLQVAEDELGGTVEREVTPRERAPAGREVTRTSG